MKKNAVITLLAVVLLIVVARTGFGASPVSAQQGVQRWEYAEMFYKLSDGTAFAVISDKDEATTVNTELTEMSGTGTKAHPVSFTYFMDIMGINGWELVDQQTDNSGQLFVFKRPSQR